MNNSRLWNIIVGIVALATICVLVFEPMEGKLHQPVMAAFFAVIALRVIKRTGMFSRSR